MGISGSVLSFIGEWVSVLIGYFASTGFIPVRGKPRPSGWGWIAHTDTALPNVLFYQKYVIL